jgi:transposase-like protein
MLLECWNCPHYKQLGRLTQSSLNPEPAKVFAEIPPPENLDVTSPEVKKVCCDMYSHGYTVQEIQEIVGIPNRKTIRNYLREAGLSNRSGNYSDDVKRRCLELYAQRQTVQQIENETGVPADTITDWAYQGNVSRRVKYSAEVKQKCIDLYAAGHSSEDVHAMTGIPTVTIKTWISQAGIGRKQKRYSEKEKTRYLDLYLEGKTPREIEETYGVKSVTLRSWVRQNNLNSPDEAEAARKRLEARKANQINRERKPDGYWKNIDNVVREVRRVNEARGELDTIPPARELQDLGQSGLVHAISKHHGGFQAVAEYMGLAVRRKRSQYWYDFENLKQELFAYVQEHGEAGVMPTQVELGQAGKGALSAAIALHGGILEVARKLNLELSYDRRPRNYWKNLDNLKAEIEEVSRELGVQDRLPTHEELIQLGRTDIVSAIAKNGGWPSVSRRLGYTYSRKT